MRQIDTLILQSIHKYSNIIMFSLDTNYRYISFSQKYNAVIKNKLDIDIKIGDCMLDSIEDTFDKNRAKCHFDKVLKGDSFTLSEEFIDKKTISTHWENYYTPIYENENIIGINIIIFDVTHHVRISRKFDEVKLFEEIVNLIDVGIAIVDPHQQDIPIIYINNSFSKITGYQKDEVIGKNGSFLHQNDLEQDEIKLLEDAISNKSKCEVVLRFYKKDNTLFFALLNITPILDINGEVIYVVGVLIDITNTIEIKKLESIKKLSAGLTHEINTALTSMSGNVEMLEYDIETLNNKKIKHNINDCLNEIKKSKKIISNITTSLHYLNNLPVNTEEKINIAKTLLHALNNFKDKIKQYNIKISINNQDIEKIKDIKIFYNAEDKVLIHLWTILLDNSIDSLVLKDGLKNINIEIYQNIKEIILSVTDNGIGISDNVKNNIFEPLIKGKSFGGIGMGLFNAKNIVEAYNGRISFRSDKTQTNFSIIFYNTCANSLVD